MDPTYLCKMKCMMIPNQPFSFIILIMKTKNDENTNNIDYWPQPPSFVTVFSGIEYVEPILSVHPSEQ